MILHLVSANCQVMQTTRRVQVAAYIQRWGTLRCWLRWHAYNCMPSPSNAASSSWPHWPPWSDWFRSVVCRLGIQYGNTLNCTASGPAGQPRTQRPPRTQGLPVKRRQLVPGTFARWLPSRLPGSGIGSSLLPLQIHRRAAQQRRASKGVAQGARNGGDVRGCNTAERMTKPHHTAPLTQDAVPPGRWIGSRWR